ncbi:hypothetical protein FALBO_14194 [Fusarium albosuccineum]|uniref:Heterokaryon incompatibility protein n=1 Tax=Fusarium albosuccineum TaxID=1237068 RepID=A0A8H4KX19_9HYPO|nr:hypothetical protein FALBO_14194 [Fusarium albosuccineum]
MAEFYKRADVLVSAASASHCGEGFLQPRNVDQCYGAIYKLPFKWEFPNREVKGSMFLCEKTLNYISDEDPLHMRIWTYQEHLVSTRVISFGTRQIKWKCQKDGNVVDGGDCSIPDGDLEHHLNEAFSPSPYSSENLVEINWRVQAWMKIVEKYSFRHYSRPQDRLPAFFESISYLAPFVGWPTSECLAGIWKADATRQLLWKKEKPLSAEESNLDQISGPSWSWATLPGGVIYDFGVQLRDLNDSFKTIEFVEEPETPLRLVTGGYIQEAYWKEEFFGNLMKRQSSGAREHCQSWEILWEGRFSPVWKTHSPTIRPAVVEGGQRAGKA